ncbi:MAG: putative manganese transporter [Clostridiales bacterium]|nr:putative manganese transporter [Clostridiales bacterium]
MENNIMDLLMDAFLDAAKLLPFLFFIYILIEYLEHENNNLVHKMFAKSKKFGPVLGAVFGTIPQCGFSVIASELFSKRAITMGTMIAIFVATSDEAIPLMLAHPDRIYDLMKLIVIKLVIAVIAGFLVDVIYKSNTKELTGDNEHSFHGNCESCEGGVLKSAVIHAVKIFLFIFAANIVIGYAAENLAPLMQFISNHTVLQSLLAPLFGIIPNCAASVVLTELYLAGKITLSSLIGGLCTGAGVGLMVLFKQNKNLRQNLIVLALIYAIGAAAGLGLGMAAGI